MKKLAALALVLLLVYVSWSYVHKSLAGKRYPPGVLISTDPQMSMLSTMRRWRVKKYLLTAEAEYEADARVLSTARYWTGRERDLSPEDLALGWGPMSDQKILIPGQGIRPCPRIKKGELIHLNGYLVKVEAPDGWNWESSLDKCSEGPQGCKLIWVQDLNIR